MLLVSIISRLGATIPDSLLNLLLVLASVGRISGLNNRWLYVDAHLSVLGASLTRSDGWTPCALVRRAVTSRRLSRPILIWRFLFVLGASLTRSDGWTPCIAITWIRADMLQRVVRLTLTTAKGQPCSLTRSGGYTASNSRLVLIRRWPDVRLLATGRRKRIIPECTCVIPTWACSL